MYKELLEYIVKRLVQYPEKVEVIQVENEISQSNLQKLKVKVAKEDMGRVIGKEGRIIRSIRELVYSYAMKNKEKVSVDVEEIKGQDE
jgi:predicted RNA-binding protein YlqC (UPF0109 family)